MSSSMGRGAGLDESSKPCRACTDFKSWMKSKHHTKQQSNKSENDSSKMNKESHAENSHSDCPLDKSELGRTTWSFLHTMAEYYPSKPTTEEKSEMKGFIQALSKFYPCDYCAKDFQDDLKTNEPNVSNTKELSQYFCQLHNRINVKLGKPVFDCNKTKQRWKDGWSDGRCN